MALNNLQRMIPHKTQTTGKMDYIYIYIYYHQGVSTARIPLTFSRHPSKSVCLLDDAKIDECKILLVGQHWCVHV